jgi:predicted nucleotide-binding protein
MRKVKKYPRARFSAEVLKRASESLWAALGEAGETSRTLLVAIDDARWTYDNEAEFFADYRRSTDTAYYWLLSASARLEVTAESNDTEVSVQAPDRSSIEATFAIFEAALSHSLMPEPASEPMAKPTVFIGHGRDDAWRDLKDHLHEQHGYPVEAYETGSRAGHAVRDVLEDMLNSSSFAILVMTGEDETAAGDVRARQNVVHEAGLFQGKLGFNRAIVLVENGVETFSNIAGIQQIRFDRGQVRSTFGDVLATLRREFGGDDA